MKLFYRFSRSLFKTFFQSVYNHQTYGIEHLPAGPAIIAPNHASYFDPPLVSVSCPEEIYFLARKSLFGHFLLGSAIKNLNAIPVSLATQDFAALKAIFQLLQQNKKIVIFPEGVRTFDGRFSMIKPGIGMICLKSRCPIIPAYIAGTYEIWPRDQRWPLLRGKTACAFGTPIHPREYSQLDKKKAQEEIAKRLYAAIRQLKEWHAHGAQGSPP